MSAQPVFLAVYGDSLSMPRSFGGVRCDEVYAELLRSQWKGPAVVFNRSQGGIRIKELFERFRQDLGYISEDKNKVLIIQCGVVDCAPRPIPFALRRLIGKLPTRVRGAIIGFLHKNRAAIQKIVRFRFTSPERFRKILNQWLLTAAPLFEQVYVIGVFPTTKEVAAHSPGFDESIRLYNRIISEEVDSCASQRIVLIDGFGEITRSKERIEKFVSEKDGHHLTSDGHQLIKKLILGKI